jgi:hypothetical protein
MGEAVDYLTPSEARLVLSTQWARQAVVSAERQFLSLRYNVKLSWDQNLLHFNNLARTLHLSERRRYNQLYQWMEGTDWRYRLWGIGGLGGFYQHLDESVTDEAVKGQLEKLLRDGATLHKYLRSQSTAARAQALGLGAPGSNAPKRKPDGSPDDQQEQARVRRGPVGPVLELRGEGIATTVRDIVGMIMALGLHLIRFPICLRGCAKFSLRKISALSATSSITLRRAVLLRLIIVLLHMLSILSCSSRSQVVCMHSWIRCSCKSWRPQFISKCCSKWTSGNISHSNSTISSSRRHRRLYQGRLMLRLEAGLVLVLVGVVVMDRLVGLGDLLAGVSRLAGVQPVGVGEAVVVHPAHPHQHHLGLHRQAHRILAMLWQNQQVPRGIWPQQLWVTIVTWL